MMIPLQRRLSWLSCRERIVLVHMMNGLSVEEIAAAEFVSISTVRTQIRSILQKLGVRTQLAAVALVYRGCVPEHEQVVAAVITAVAS